MRKFKPNDLATIKLPVSERRRVVEVISHPTPEDTIMVRMVPGELTTMIEVKVASLQSPCVPFCRWLHIAEVRTAFPFPEDMLRHDSAALYDHTIDERDYKTKTYCDRSADDPVLVYTVRELRKEPWTIARWESFVCGIKHMHTFDLRRGRGGH